MKARTVVRSAIALAATLLLSTTAHALLFRAYLSGGGNDANPCTLPAPCRLLPAALAAVADGGEIWMLDSANYNTSTVTVTKSVSILSIPGEVGSVLAIGGPAIGIATASVNVALRNLRIVPLAGGGGTSGISMTNGASLTVENCVISNLPGDGVAVTGSIAVRIDGTTIRNNGGNGLTAKDGASAAVTRSTISRHGSSSFGILADATAASTTTTVDVADSTVDGNGVGINANSGSASATARVTVKDSRILQNSTTGVRAASSAGGTASLSVSNSVISGNYYGLVAYQAGAKVWASGNTVSNNYFGIYNYLGLVESAGNNAVRNNDSDGTMTPVGTM
jgi:hypothetical protein